MATATIKTNYNRYRPAAARWDGPISSHLWGGLTGSGSQYAVVLGFDLSAYLAYPINGITLYVYRFDDDQADSKSWDYLVASAVNSNGTVTSVAGSGGSFSYTAKEAWKSVALSAAAVDAMAGGNEYIYLYSDTNGQYAGIRPLEYSSGAYAAYVVVDYTPEPAPTTPTITAPGTITSSSKTFDWSAASDTKGIFTSAQLMYEMQLSTNGGTSWGSTYTTAANVSQQAVNMQDYVDYVAGTDYYNATCKVRVRTKTPSLAGTTYYSAWSTAASFVVDYRYAPPAPTVSAAGTITAASKTFDWTDVASVNGVYASTQTVYEMQLSTNNGTAWGSTYTTAAGTTQQAVNMQTTVGYTAGTDYYNTTCKFRVRAKSPNGHYSAWTVSSAFTVDYRFAPPAPALNAPGTITAASKTFEWSDVASVNGVYASTLTVYEMQLSANSGSAWGSTYTTAAGISLQAVNVQTFVGYSAGVDYYNASCMFRVRAKSPNGHYSPWAVSSAFIVDYNYAPPSPAIAAPGTVTTASKTFSWSAVASANGVYPTEQLTYEMEISANGASWTATTALAAGVRQQSVNVQTFVGYTAGTDYYNAACTVRARAKTPNGHVGPWEVSDPFTVNYRFAPPAPAITVPGTITTDSKTFDWSDVASANGVYTASQTAYELQISKDNGATWSGTYAPTTAGVSQLSVDIRGFLNLGAGRYYLNSSCMVRVRGKSPNGHYSPWTASDKFTVDYSVTPTQPAAPALSKAAPYEGEAITMTCSRPGAYNTLDNAGNTNVLKYTVRMGATVLASGSAPVTSASIALPYTVGQLTTGTADLPASLTVTCVDTQNLASPASAATAMTIKRYRAPAVAVTKVDRTETTATVRVNVTDTGYGGTQASAQVRSILYRLDEGNWTQASLSAWSGLTASFPLNNLTDTERYALEIKAYNATPTDTALNDLEGAVYAATVLEYSPATFAWRDATTGGSGFATKALVVGADYAAAVDPGWGVFQNGIKVGSNTAWHSGNAPKYAQTLTGDATSAALWRSLEPGTYWNANNSLTNAPSAYALIRLEKTTDGSNFYITCKAQKTGHMWYASGNYQDTTITFYRMWSDEGVTLDPVDGSLPLAGPLLPSISHTSHTTGATGYGAATGVAWTFGSISQYRVWTIDHQVSTDNWWIRGYNSDGTTRSWCTLWHSGNFTPSNIPTQTDTMSGPRLRLTSTIDAALTSTGHALQIGADTAENLIIDGNEMMCRNNGAYGPLNLNPDGGNVRIGLGGWNNGHLQLGANYHLWVDASGKLRMKNSAPTSDTDGAVVGTQA